MLSNEQVAMVRMFLAAGCSLREAASRAGVSRGSAAAVASGRWRAHDRVGLRGSSGVVFGVGPRQRCPRCGMRVYGACLRCYLEFDYRPGGSLPVPVR